MEAQDFTKVAEGKTIVEKNPFNLKKVVDEAPECHLPIPEKPLHVLLVDDNKPNLMFLKIALEKLSLVCDTAGNGEIAIGKAAEYQYDLILMDCQMPVMDGYAASEAIRKLQAPYGEVPIIALTANATVEDRTRCLDAGMNDYLTKPIMLGELCQKISRVTSRPSERQPKQAQYEKSIDLLIQEMHFTEKEARKLLDEFFLTIPGFIQKMDSALEEENHSEISALAHQMRGISSNLRLRALQAASARLEDSAKRKSGEVKREIGALKALLTGFRSASIEQEGARR